MKTSFYFKLYITQVCGVILCVCISSNIRSTLVLLYTGVDKELISFQMAILTQNTDAADMLSL